MTNDDKSRIATLDKWEGDIVKRMPRHLDTNFATHLIMSLKIQFHKIPALFNVDKATLKEAIMDLSDLGLILGGARKQAFLIPFGSKCELVIGYPGVIELLSRSPNFKSVVPDVAYKGDTVIEEGGTHSDLIHHKTRSPQQMTEDNITHFNAIIKFKEGTPDFVNLYRHEVDATKNKVLEKRYKKCPQKKKDSFWITNYVDMGKKTAILRLGKYMPSHSYDRMLQIGDKYSEPVEEQKTWEGDYHQQNTEQSLTDTLNQEEEITP